MGLTATPAEVRDADRTWRERLGARRDDATFPLRMGMDASDARRLCEDAALMEKLLELALRLFPDALSFDEALASEARWKGTWPGARPRKGRR